MKSTLRTILAVICILLGIRGKAQQPAPIRIVAYNVENLFDTKNDSLRNDDEFLPDGTYHWTYGRYLTKLSHIAQVIAAIGEWTPPAIIGMVEVETDSCLIQLQKWHLGKNYPYKSVLIEGPDNRGIDPGLLYDTTRLQLIDFQSISVGDSNGEWQSRDILHCSFAKIDTADTLASELLHLLLCHFPSQRGGAAQSADKREIAQQVLYRTADAILQTDSSALILAMGDFNSEPQDNLIPLLHNLMIPLAKADRGTYKFHGIWSCLDQFYASDALLPLLSEPHIFAPEWLLEEDPKYVGSKPFRTYMGPRYNGGYSDHLPIYMDLNW